MNGVNKRVYFVGKNIISYAYLAFSIACTQALHSDSDSALSSKVFDPSLRYITTTTTKNDVRFGYVSIEEEH
ncbi:hypothetical protein DERP_006771 [Dermatophagoides pteronyssinus]|uniref:Uncharacterized protein n=1 Tax=Dermatophagoides pteronyssinus TaxID=6956 RepID=A0ABQ8ISP6_DERPT|nr:hypothetical protein DERP_006771 [Dermatophagoides pteronyssinus]